MYGIDISNYQRGIDLSKAKSEFAIIKATEGIGYTDKSFSNFSVQLTELDKLIGCYHFARPDLHKTPYEMEQEADWFINEVKSQNLLRKAILVLDWEKEPMDREDLLQAWVIRVISQTGITPVIYGSKSKLKGWSNWWAIKNCPIWIAAWPTIKRYNEGVNPKLTLPTKEINWFMWQYSSSGLFPGFTGNVDLDYCSWNKDEWIKQAGGNTIEKENISEDMQWAIDNELFLGYGDGRYGPNDPLTREQLATVLRRYRDLYSV